MVRTVTVVFPKRNQEKTFRRQVTSLEVLRELCCQHFQLQDSDFDLMKGSMLIVDQYWVEFLGDGTGVPPRASIQMKEDYDEQEPLPPSRGPSADPSRPSCRLEDPSDQDTLPAEAAKKPIPLTISYKSLRYSGVSKVRWQIEQDYSFEPDGVDWSILDVPEEAAAEDRGDTKVPPAVLAVAMLGNKRTREATGFSPDFELELLSGQEGNLREIHSTLCRNQSVVRAKFSSGAPFYPRFVCRPFTLSVPSPPRLYLLGSREGCG